MVSSKFSKLDEYEGFTLEHKYFKMESALQDAKDEIDSGNLVGVDKWVKFEVGGYKVTHVDRHPPDTA